MGGSVFLRGPKTVFKTMPKTDLRAVADTARTSRRERPWMSAMPRVVAAAVLAALAGEAHGFSSMVHAGRGLALRSPGAPHGLLPGARSGATRCLRSSVLLRMQRQDTETDTAVQPAAPPPPEAGGADRGNFMGTKNFVSLSQRAGRAAACAEWRAHRIASPLFN